MADILIISQETPNPLALKFVVNFDIKTAGKVSFTDQRECAHVPLASALLELADVAQVHLFDNVITISQSGAADWSTLEELVKAGIEEHVEDHDAGFIESEESKNSRHNPDNYTPEMKEIDSILEREVRPYLQADGGDLFLTEYEGNLLGIEYEGACGTCPSAGMGTLQSIQSVLRAEYNRKIVVIAD